MFLPYSPNIVSKALNDFVSKQGRFAQRNDTGFLLSQNTTLDKNNKGGFDMHFFCGLRNEDNPNKSVLYLNLESSREDQHGNTEVNQFDMQQAKDYLDHPMP